MLRRWWMCKNKKASSKITDFPQCLKSVYYWRNNLELAPPKSGSIQRLYFEAPCSVLPLPPPPPSPVKIVQTFCNCLLNQASFAIIGPSRTFLAYKQALRCALAAGQEKKKSTQRVCLQARTFSVISAQFFFSHVNV